MRKFQSIQYLRALAAVMVVFHHARGPAIGHFAPLAGFGAGQAGVDIFFVISGFVMYAAARNEAPLNFLQRRFIRVAPLYWLATCAAFVLANRMVLAHLPPGMPDDLLRSLLFIPHYSRDHPGQIWPYLVPGWTLNYEMFFYAIFAFALKARRLVPVVLLTLGALVAGGLLLPSTNPLWRTYSDPLLLEFGMGVCIARWGGGLSSRAAGWLLPLGALALALSPLIAAPRVLSWGVPAAMIVLGALALERRGGLPEWHWLRRLGDASYSIYLVQVIALSVVGAGLRHVPLADVAQFAAMLTLGPAATIAAGLIVHRLVERPMTGALSQRWARQRMVTAG